MREPSFAAPGTPEAVPPWERPETKARWAAERDAFERAALERELFALRRDWEELKREIAAKRAAERREAEELRIKSDLAFENFRRAFKSYAQQRKYSPDQPRVPAGNSDGGQWTSGGGSGAGRGVGGVQSTDANAERVRLAADITGFTRHGMYRAMQRGISPSSMQDAVVNPIEIVPQVNGTTKYVGRDAVVVLNPAGQVVTVWGR